MRNVVRKALTDALDALRREGWSIPADVEVPLDRPKRPEHGDIATNLAMTLARPTGRKPREIADALSAELRRHVGDARYPISSVEIAGPGFLNLRLRDRAFHAVIEQVLAAGTAYGRLPPHGDGSRTMVEFVSANPTGPMHLGHGRGAVVGDVLVRVLRAAGYDVATEYYINDAGAQVHKLALSARAIAKGESVPDGGYGGAYVHDLVAELKRDRPELLASGDDPALAEECVARMMAGIRRTLDALGVEFDVYFSERSLTAEGKLDRVLKTLGDGGHLEERDGALFFKSSSAGEDDKDRVLRKTNGEYTYFAPDLAYHQDKLLRGFNRLIDVWGADHHGYAPRMRAGLEALGLPKESFEVLFIQLVKLLKYNPETGKKEEVKFSKRAGNFITIDEVIEEVDRASGQRHAGRDAVRFLFLTRSHESPVEFDLDLASKQTVENPVFYAQMSHARMCSIFDRVRTSEDMAPARSAGVLSIPEQYDEKLAEKLTLPEERDILALCDSFAELIRDAAAARGPHRVVFFVQELAQAFASYFTRMQKVHDEPILPQKSYRDAHPDWVARWDWDKTRARLLWLLAVRQVYANALALVGIEAPTRMDRNTAVEDESAS